MNLKNLVGKRFSLLTVTERYGVNSSNHVTWRCVCECGKTSVHTGNNLHAGHSKSCGCLKHRRIAEDLSGKRFGRLTAVSLVSTRRGVARWACACRCGKRSTVPAGHLKSGHTKSCGCLVSEVSRKHAKKKLAGKKKVAPNGTLPNRKLQGYVQIHDRNHPRSGQGGFVYEHIVVMERKTGRSLQKCETVHHINGDRSDNRPRNLELWSKSHPCGQRVSDKLKWCIEMLNMYRGFRLGNTVKDLEKAVWYIQDEIQKRKKGDSEGN